MNEEKVIEKLLEHDDRFDEMVNRVEFQEFKDQVLTGQDQMLGILKRLDQERVFTNERIKRMEAEIGQHTQEIQQIKLQLQVA